MLSKSIKKKEMKGANGRRKNSIGEVDYSCAERTYRGRALFRTKSQIKIRKASL